MKPIIIIPPGTISDEDIKLLRENDICVVVAKDPAKVKFVDPIPAVSSRTEIENAAIKLSRCLLNGTWAGPDSLDRRDICKLYLEFMVQGTPLESRAGKKEGSP